MNTPEGWVPKESIQWYLDFGRTLYDHEKKILCRMALAALTLHAENSELKSIINSDGSLETHDDHVSILRDAMHALGKINVVAQEIERWKREALAARPFVRIVRPNERSKEWRAAKAANTPATGEASN